MEVHFPKKNYMQPFLLSPVIFKPVAYVLLNLLGWVFNIFSLPTSSRCNKPIPPTFHFLYNPQVNLLPIVYAICKGH